MKGTVNRLDILLARDDSNRTWFAYYEGVTSTGQYMTIERQSKSAGEALVLLEEALKEQGWEVR